MLEFTWLPWLVRMEWVGRGLLGVWPIGMQPSGLPAATGVELCGTGGLRHGLALNEVLRLERSSGPPPSGASPPGIPPVRYRGRSPDMRNRERLLSVWGF